MRLRWGPGLHTALGQRIDCAAYDQYIGRWSRLFVPALIAAAEVTAGDRVLDIATGPGDAARAALSAAGRAGRVVGADLSLAMLEAAATRVSTESFWTVATDGQALAFRDGSFDAVVCQLGLMFFPNPSRGLAEFRRVLRPHGRAAICVISSADRAPIWGVLAEALSRHLPEERDTLHLSFALADPAQLAELLSAADFRDIRVQRETRHGVIESFEDYWTPIEVGAGQLPHAYRSLSEASRREVRDTVRAGLARFEVDGRFAVSVEMLIGSGRVATPRPGAR